MCRSPVSRRSYTNLLLSAAGLGLWASFASAQVPGTIASDPFVGGIAQGALVRIGDVATLPDSSFAPARMNSAAQSPDGRFFVLDQRGPVYSLSGGTATQFFNINSLGLSLLNDDQERGASTVAFHPQFTQVGAAGYGKFYVAFSTSNTTPTPDYSAGGTRTHDEVVYELSAANPLAATYTQAVAPREVLRIARPAGNHNGGQLGFNPNAAVGTDDYGKLYVSTGDSGGGGDPLQQAQNNNSLQGKILRINPAPNTAPITAANPSNKYTIAATNTFASDGNPATRPEIYATGFRNPQRFSWDSVNGKLYAGDVGQGRIEEIDVVTNGGNYGWGTREGRFVYSNTTTVLYPPNPDNTSFVQPIFEYDHDEGAAVSGGFVYRGTAIPSLTGKYVFGDLNRGRIFYGDAEQVFGGQAAISELRLTENGTTARTLLSIINDGGFGAGRVDLRLGQDALGNLFVLNKQDGIVRMLLPAIVPEPATTAVLAGAALLGLRRRRV